MTFKYFNNNVFPLKLINNRIKYYIFKNKNSPKEKQLIRLDQTIIYKYYYDKMIFRTSSFSRENKYLIHRVLVIIVQFLLLHNKYQNYNKTAC